MYMMGPVIVSRIFLFIAVLIGVLVVGDKEIETESVGVRSRKDGDIGQMDKEEFISKIKQEIRTYTRN